eukprot:scpid89532/ scgid34328/ 
MQLQVQDTGDYFTASTTAMRCTAHQELFPDEDDELCQCFTASPRILSRKISNSRPVVDCEIQPWLAIKDHVAGQRCQQALLQSSLQKKTPQCSAHPTSEFLALGGSGVV